MNIRCLPLIVALAVAASSLLALGETSELSAPPPAAAAAASAPALTRPGPRLPSAAEQRDNAAAPDLRVERPVTPQLIVPLGRRIEAPRVSRTAVTRRAGAASASGIDDAAARCEAEAGEVARAACHEKLAHETKPR